MGDVIDALPKVDEIDRASEALRNAIARGSLKLKRKAKALEAEKESTTKITEVERGRQLERNRVPSTEQREKPARESSPTTAVIMPGGVSVDTETTVI